MFMKACGAPCDGCPEIGCHMCTSPRIWLGALPASSAWTNSMGPARDHDRAKYGIKGQKGLIKHIQVLNLHSD
jgi:hypothetical protein